MSEVKVYKPIDVISLLMENPGIRIVLLYEVAWKVERAIADWFDFQPLGDSICNHFDPTRKMLVMTNGSQLRFKSYTDSCMVKGWESGVVLVGRRVDCYLREAAFERCRLSPHITGIIDFTKEVNSSGL